jgi:pantetheine-phosphate adenylyltransferase
MAQRGKKIIAVYAGSFDPVTHGHVDVIRRASKLVNELLVAIGTNPDKSPMFSPEERLALLRPHLRGLPNVRAKVNPGLTIDFARDHAAQILLRGIRDVADLSNELQQAELNMQIGRLETVFLLTSDQNILTSSTYIKQIFELGGGDLRRITQLVPANVARALGTKLRRRKNGR